ncbi:hypothetical protein EG347_00575 [Chryseobacterium sp. G0186]|nr:hypothetical protein EG347_00575 [Chryseobacterium sp. G0186]
MAKIQRIFDGVVYAPITLITRFITTSHQYLNGLQGLPQAPGWGCATGATWFGTAFTPLGKSLYPLT